MFNNVRDISGEDLGVLDKLRYTRFGYTVDNNRYPILNNVDNGWVVGVPVEDYLAIQKHFDSVDETLTRIEDALGDEEEEITAWQQTKPQIPVHQGDASVFDALGYVLGLPSPKPSMPEDVSFKIETIDNVVRINTYLHTISNGVHREQQVTRSVPIGYQPFSLTRPVALSIMYLSPTEIEEYVEKVLTWKQREKDIKHWYANKDEVLAQVKEEMKVEMRACIEHGSISAIDKTLPPYEENYITQFKLNPYAIWISDDEDVPERYKMYLLRLTAGE